MRQTVIPDVTNKHYQEATIELQNAGFIVEIANTEASDTVTVDYVISTDPAPGEELAAGSTVFLTVLNFEVPMEPEASELPKGLVVNKIYCLIRQESVCYISVGKNRCAYKGTI